MLAGTVSFLDPKRGMMMFGRLVVLCGVVVLDVWFSVVDFGGVACDARL